MMGGNLKGQEETALPTPVIFKGFTIRKLKLKEISQFKGIIARIPPLIENVQSPERGDIKKFVIQNLPKFVEIAPDTIADLIALFTDKEAKDAIELDMDDVIKLVKKITEVNRTLFDLFFVGILNTVAQVLKRIIAQSGLEKSKTT